MKKRMKVSLEVLKVSSAAMYLSQQEVTEIYGGATVTCPGDPSGAGDGFGSDPGDDTSGDPGGAGDGLG